MVANCTADEETCTAALQPDTSDTQTKSQKYVQRLSRAEPIVKIAAVVVLVLFISLPLIFLLGAVFALTGVMRVDDFCGGQRVVRSSAEHTSACGSGKWQTSSQASETV